MSIQQIKQILIQHNALKEFIEISSKTTTGCYSMRPAPFCGHFSWALTPQGYDFWRNIDSKVCNLGLEDFEFSETELALHKIKGLK